MDQPTNFFQLNGRSGHDFLLVDPDEKKFNPVL
jgi:hypothetical protein